MGHLINPLSFRLVYFSLYKNKSFDFLLNNVDLYKYLLIKQYFLNLFNQKNFVELSFIFGSVHLIEKKYNIQIMLYLSNKMLSDLFEKIFKLQNKKRRYIWKLKDKFFSYKKFFFLFLFNFFKIFSVFIKNELYLCLKKKIQLNVNIYKPTIVTAEVMIRYIKKRLEQNFWVGKIMNEVKSVLKKELPFFNIIQRDLQLLGFRLKCSGRFSRKQRASSFSYTVGKVPLSTVTAFVDFSMDSISLRFGACGLKIWLYWSRPFNMSKDTFNLF